MPYNNAPIPPPEEISGQSILPLTRIKKIIQMDEDIAQCSNNAAFVISIATEMFIRYLAEQSFNVVKSERKPRRNIQYKDMANAVARIDNLEFLADVIPRTTTYRQFKEKKAKEAANGTTVEAGQTTLEGRKPQAIENGINGVSGPSHPSDMNGTYPPREMIPLRSPATSEYPSILSPTNGTFVDRTVDQNSHAHPSNRDVEMAG